MLAFDQRRFLKQIIDHFGLKINRLAKIFIMLIPNQ